MLRKAAIRKFLLEHHHTLKALVLLLILKRQSMQHLPDELWTVILQSLSVVEM